MRHIHTYSQDAFPPPFLHFTRLTRLSPPRAQKSRVPPTLMRAPSHIRPRVTPRCIKRTHACPHKIPPSYHALICLEFPSNYNPRSPPCLYHALLSCPHHIYCPHPHTAQMTTRKRQPHVRPQNSPFLSKPARPRTVPHPHSCQVLTLLPRFVVRTCVRCSSPVRPRDPPEAILHTS